ncbi:hypothetical protein TIFTF001_039984 [Ficus carica]|uniref:Uncharacterized protein n=1 Tax=Ficus carica TaxID=3494 RepID=A0AA87YXR8_FICCA|nr:hypothetical protein TIFTF001_039978 [Ficus carica]GMN20930.1 hypothetical protein TIFTF001_039980 [Ficus carica]GMN20941.1 hypothetical protein TIFTF001_039982 [Ficus carica]GMN20947.1 hypothetical protein TIFTF001_039984 [Ficus carica]
MIGDFSEQQTQGSLESMGTNDILTKSLGNDENSTLCKVQGIMLKYRQRNDSLLRWTEPYRNFV